jgi:hypothetical protein
MFQTTFPVGVNFYSMPADYPATAVDNTRSQLLLSHDAMQMTSVNEIFAAEPEY